MVLEVRNEHEIKYDVDLDMVLMVFMYIRESRFIRDLPEVRKSRFRDFCLYGW